MVLSIFHTTLLESLSKVGVANVIKVDFGNRLLIGSEAACEKQVIRIQELTVMTSIEIVHFRLYLSNTGQMRPFLHHLQHALILQPSSDALSVLH